MNLDGPILSPILRRTFPKVEGGAIWVWDHAWRRFEGQEFDVPLTYCEGPLPTCCRGLQLLRDSCPATEDVYAYWEPRAVTPDASAIERLDGGSVRFGVRWCLISNDLPSHPFGAEAQARDPWTRRSTIIGPLVCFEFALRHYYERALRLQDERLALRQLEDARMTDDGCRLGAR
jgi:hypothetical protein